METDQELLELAAKAAGIQLIRWNDGEEPYSSGLGFILPSNRLWNPLTDDGDALRLMVSLGLMVDCSIPGRVQCAGDYGIGLEEYDSDTINKSEATRRAIVRAAAEIGKRMK